MDWKSIGQSVGSIAPVLGTLLGGPAGAAVGTLVAQALGTKDDPESVNAAILADPSAAMKLQELQMNNKVELQRLTLQLETTRIQADGALYVAEAADRDSARRLAATQPNDYVRPLITFVLLFGALAIVCFIFFGVGREILKDPVATSTIGIAIGFWFNELKQATGFYFGMTKEGASQNREISRFATAAGTVTTAPAANEPSINNNVVVQKGA